MEDFELIRFGVDIESEYVQVYLHGKGGFSSLESLYEFSDFPRLAKNSVLKLASPFVVVRGKVGEHWTFELVSNALFQIKHEYPHKVIHLIGYSRGGDGVYRYLSGGGTVGLATVINSRVPEDFSSHVLLQVIHATADHTEPMNRVVEFVNGLRESGQDAFFESFEGDHFSIGEIALSGIVESAIDNHRQLTQISPRRTFTHS